MTDCHDRIGIVGAGLVGSLLSIYLAQRGFAVDLYEKRPDMRKSAMRGGRSIVMSISYRGLKGLDGVGLRSLVEGQTHPKYSRMVHLPDGTTTEQAYGRDRQSINTVDRKQLNCNLLDRAEATGRVKIYFNHQLQSMDIRGGGLVLEDIETGNLLTRTYDRIIGADGMFSRVREALEAQGDTTSDRLNMQHGYRELGIPPVNGGWALPEHLVHVWPRRNYILVALPKLDKSYTCTLFLPADGDLSLASITSEADVFRLFRAQFADVIPLMPTMVDDFFSNPASRLFSVKCSPWNYEDRVLVLGDAAHAIVPFFAMGMNVGFEDCTVFDGLMEEFRNDLGAVIREFGARRKPDTDAIADLSAKNFSEIAHSPDPDYNFKWALERRIWETYPDRWMPLYPMIAFSHMPLREAVQRNQRQKEILAEIIPRVKTDATDYSDAFLDDIVRTHVTPRLLAL